MSTRPVPSTSSAAGVGALVALAIGLFVIIATIIAWWKVRHVRQDLDYLGVGAEDEMYRQQKGAEGLLLAAWILELLPIALAILGIILVALGLTAYASSLQTSQRQFLPSPLLRVSGSSAQPKKTPTKA